MLGVLFLITGDFLERQVWHSDGVCEHFCGGLGSCSSFSLLWHPLDSYMVASVVFVAFHFSLDGLHDGSRGFSSCFITCSLWIGRYICVIACLVR